MMRDGIPMETFEDLVQDAAYEMDDTDLMWLCRDVGLQHNTHGGVCDCRPVAYTRAEIRSQTITKPRLDS